MESACYALLIQATKYGESSLIVKLLREDGVITTCIAKSTSRKNSATPAAVFQPLGLLNVELSHKGNPDAMHNLKSASFAENPNSIYQNPIKQAILFFYAEVLQQLLKQDFQNDYKLLYNYIIEKKEELSSAEQVSPYLPIIFLLDLAQFSGIGIDPESYEFGYGFDISESRFVPRHHMKMKELFLDSNAAELLAKLIMKDEIDTLYSKGIRNEVLEKLSNYFKVHFQGSFKLKSPEILSVVLG